MSVQNILKTALYILIFLNLFFISAIIAYQVTLRGEVVSVPDLAGKTFEEARSQLNAKKLTIAQSGIRLDERFDRGKIVFQDPPADKKIKLHQTIRVILSAGKEKVEVPRLIGRSFQMISSVLKDTGLKKGRNSHIYTNQYAAGRIIAQSPLPDESVAKGSRISLLVSEGAREQRYLMPDLIGRHAERVIAQLKDLGFRVSDLRESYYPGIESGIIIKQFPKQGYPVQKRNLITLEVSK